MTGFDKNKKTAMFIQPMFEYKSEEWLAMVYGWPKQIKPDSTFLMGFAFKTEEYAKEFFGLLRAYNDGQSIDVENNIRISLITEDLKDYSVYIYPSNDRKNVVEFVQESEKEFGKHVQHGIMNLTMCRPFPYGEGSTFKVFKDIYVEGSPVELKAFYLRDGNRPEVIKSVEPILKYDIKVTHRKLLTKNDHEYHHGKSIMDK
ncbi:hypothetical protein [Priestia koreensis]|uniref:hypothetical protein n=1 Tax=Priestia koreensis TaxID=284581 RepID=UPI00301B1533